MKALLVDDHSLFRHGLELILTMRIGFDEVFHAQSGAEALACLSENPKIDLVILDYYLGNDNGLTVLANIKANFSNARVAIISGSDRAELIVRSLGEGASGFIPKNLTPQDLEKAVAQIVAGNIFVPPMSARDDISKVRLAVKDAEQQRLDHLAEVARRVIREKDLSYRVDDDGNEMTTAFNSLLADLQQEKFKLETMAFTDMLTGVANRRQFLTQADYALKSSKRSATLMALAYIDLDDFKLVNDTYGHDGGDALLIEVAMRLKNNVREVDTVARLGGDEFAVIFVNVQTREWVELVIARLFNALAEPFVLPGNKDYCLSCSMGVVLSEGQETLKKLVAVADSTMYKVKRSGKNTFLVDGGKTGE